MDAPHACLFLSSRGNKCSIWELEPFSSRQPLTSIKVAILSLCHVNLRVQTCLHDFWEGLQFCKGPQEKESTERNQEGRWASLLQGLLHISIRIEQLIVESPQSFRAFCFGLEAEWKKPFSLLLQGNGWSLGSHKGNFRTSKMGKKKLRPRCVGTDTVGVSHLHRGEQRHLQSAAWTVLWGLPKSLTVRETRPFKKEMTWRNVIMIVTLYFKPGW